AQCSSNHVGQRNATLMSPANQSIYLSKASGVWVRQPVRVSSAKSPHICICEGSLTARPRDRGASYCICWIAGNIHIEQPAFVVNGIGESTNRSYRSSIRVGVGSRKRIRSIFCCDEDPVWRG